jgi:hypothetical protein
MSTPKPLPLSAIDFLATKRLEFLAPDLPDHTDKLALRGGPEPNAVLNCGPDPALSTDRFPAAG